MPKLSKMSPELPGRSGKRSEPRGSANGLADKTRLTAGEGQDWSSSAKQTLVYQQYPQFAVESKLVKRMREQSREPGLDQSHD